MATLKVTNIKNESFAGNQLYLKTDGKIGIGTATPDKEFHLERNDTSTLAIAKFKNGWKCCIRSKWSNRFFNFRYLKINNKK